MDNTKAFERLDHFRRAVYDRVLGHRKDTMFELMEAVLVADRPSTMVRLSLEAPFRRRWPSAPDALSDGRIDVGELGRLVSSELASETLLGRPVWALDGTVWPRPAASTSPERTWAHRTTPGKPQWGTIPGWEYQWLVNVPLEGSSWIHPLDVSRRKPSSASPTLMAIDQLRKVLSHRPAGTLRPIATMDSGYDVLDLAHAIHDQADPLGTDLLVRLPKRRRFFRKAPPYSGKGAPRKHGAVFNLRDPNTWGDPDHSASLHDLNRGRIQVDVWDEMHDQHDWRLSFTLVRIQAERLPKAGRKPDPLWLAWLGLKSLDDILDYWRIYKLRFTVEHGFRFLKNDLGWTTIRPKDPNSADRWSHLLAIVLWQLWLARSLIQDIRLPWEQPRPTEELSPGRVKRAFSRLLSRLPCPAREVRPRGKSPGRQPGECPGPRARYPTHFRRVKRTPKAA
ncbi:MAG TPA: transposase [Chloroflexota bacterium]|nr:transposase [Chloroflexota bacterium]